VKLPCSECFPQRIDQSGDEPVISLVSADKPPMQLKDRWKVVEKMHMIPQYTFAGDYTGSSIPTVERHDFN